MSQQCLDPNTLNAFAEGLCLPKTLSAARTGCFSSSHDRPCYGVPTVMLQVLLAFARTLLSCLQTHRDLALENLALRHQIAVLQRSSSKRPRLARPDRALWAWLCEVWPPWRHVLVVVQPATVIRWHREAFRLFWRRKSTPAGQPGRPSADKDVIQLIRSLAEANVTWGCSSSSWRTPKARH